MSDPLTPTAGARYVLERVADAHYTGRVYTPDATYEYEAPRANYHAVLETTPEGFVRRYPGLWELEG